VTIVREIDANPTNGTFQFFMFCYFPQREIRGFVAPETMNRVFENIAGVHWFCHRNHPLPMP
jgi:hypothetical protein